MPTLRELSTLNELPAFRAEELPALLQELARTLPKPEAAKLRAMFASPGGREVMARALGPLADYFNIGDVGEVREKPFLPL